MNWSLPTSATASRIQSTTVNFGADEEKLRSVMAESFLITAAYRGSKSVLSPPQLSSSHQFFKLDNSTNRDELLRYAAIAAALSLSPATPPPGVADFGRTSVFAEAHYDDELSRALFLQSDGSPRPHADYEAAGRRAIAMLVMPDGDDAYRRRPALDDALWAQMKDLGPANFHQLFPQELQANVIGSDYVTIQWWADSMRSTGDILARMRQARQSGGSGIREVAARSRRASARRSVESAGAIRRPVGTRRDVPALRQERDRAAHHESAIRLCGRPGDRRGWVTAIPGPR